MSRTLLQSSGGLSLYLLVHLQKLLEVVEGNLTEFRSVDVPANNNKKAGDIGRRSGNLKTIIINNSPNTAVATSNCAIFQFNDL